MADIRLVLGQGECTRVIETADDLLRQYRQDTGCFYLDYQSATPPDRLVPEDLAVTLLINSQARWRAFRSLQLHCDTIDLSCLPGTPLEHTTAYERRQVADLVSVVAGWPGFAASTATKVLHKKRPDLIPILDNQAIFGAYMNPFWPGQHSLSDSIKDRASILRALEMIAADLNREENRLSWEALHAVEPARTMIQLFDSVWWMYFRMVEPVAG